MFLNRDQNAKAETVSGRDGPEDDRRVTGDVLVPQDFLSVHERVAKSSIHLVPG